MLELVVELAGYELEMKLELELEMSELELAAGLEELAKLDELAELLSEELITELLAELTELTELTELDELAELTTELEAELEAELMTTTELLPVPKALVVLLDGTMGLHLLAEARPRDALSARTV